MIKDENLSIPAAIVREWQDHAQCGKEFQAWLEDFLKQYKVIDPE